MPRPDALFPAGPDAPTNDLGEFRLFSLPPGEYYVLASPRPDLGGSPAPRSRTMLPTYFPEAADSAAAQPINVGAGETSSDIEIHMIGAPAFQVSGVVLDEGGRPVVNAVVKLIDEDQNPRARLMMGPWHQSRTDTSGTFSINIVTSGTYTLLAIAPVVIPNSAGTRGAVSTVSGSYSSWNSAGGTMGGGVMTETRDGITIEYRDDAATRVPITINDASINGLQVIVRTPVR